MRVRIQAPSGLTLGLSLVLLLGSPNATADADTRATEPDNGSPPAWEEGDTTQEGELTSQGAVTVEVSATGSVVEPAVSVSFRGGRASVVSNVTSVRVREIVQVDDPADPNYRGACVQTRHVVVPIGQEDETAATYEQVMVFDLRALFPDASPDIPACVADDDDAEGTDPALAFEEMLEPFVEQLPRPRPVLNPGTAITGLDTYLETNRPLEYGPVDGQISLGGRDFAVSLWAEGVYQVDWGMAGDGDGEAFEQVSGPHTVPGRPFEEGRPVDEQAVTHVYTTVPEEPQSVSVTDYWVVHYSIAGVVEDATLVAELEPVTVPVEVQQLQAVVVSD